MAFTRLAESETKLGQYQSGVKFIQEALKIMQPRLVERSLPVLQLKRKMAKFFLDQTKMSAAEGLFKEIMKSNYFLLVESEIITEGDDFAFLLRESIEWPQERAISHYLSGRYENAEVLFRESYDKVRGVFGNIDRLSKQIKTNLEKNELGFAKTRETAFPR